MSVGDLRNKRKRPSEFDPVDIRRREFYEFFRYQENSDLGIGKAFFNFCAKLILAVNDNSFDPAETKPHFCIGIVTYNEQFHFYSFPTIWKEISIP